MKFLKFSLFLLCCSFAFSFSAIAQDEDAKLGDVDLSFLSGQTNFNIQYSYDNMTVGEKTEADYRKDKIAKFDEKEPGKGERWEKNWVNARQLAYQPSFEELLGKTLTKEKTNATANEDVKGAKYTILVHTIFTEPGFNAVVMKKNPYCIFEISFIDNATGKVQAKASVKAAGVLFGGSAFDFDPANSIKECYAKAGKVIGKAMAKAIKR
ncbi:MAG TPA: hypothetical protein VK705_03200 [Ferruginibacter sp.]|jgi:hypothetical protein|nr:hypothetical protein [Ferruginibacter sp.]